MEVQSLHSFNHNVAHHLKKFNHEVGGKIHDFNNNVKHEIHKVNRDIADKLGAISPQLDLLLHKAADTAEHFLEQSNAKLATLLTAEYCTMSDPKQMTLCAKAFTDAGKLLNKGDKKLLGWLDKGGQGVVSHMAQTHCQNSPLDPMCACLSSNVPNPECFDPKCDNAFQTPQMMIRAGKCQNQCPSILSTISGGTSGLTADMVDISACSTTDGYHDAYNVLYPPLPSIPSSPSKVESEWEKHKDLWIVLIVTVIVLALSGGGFLLYRSQRK